MFGLTSNRLRNRFFLLLLSKPSVKIVRLKRGFTDLVDLLLIGLGATTSVADVLDAVLRARAGSPQSKTHNYWQQVLSVYKRLKIKLMTSVTFNILTESVTLVLRVLLRTLQTGLQVKVLLMYLEETTLIGSKASKGFVDL